MDTLVRGHRHSDSVNGFEFNQNHFSASSDRNLVNGYQIGGGFTEVSGLSNVSSSLPVISASLSEGETNQVECDYFDGVFKYIQQILMEEEDSEDRPCMFQDCLALQAAEKVFYQVLHEDSSSPSPLRSPSPTIFGAQNVNNPEDDFAISWNHHHHKDSGFTAVNDHVVDHQTFESDFLPFNSAAASSFCNVDELVYMNTPLNQFQIQESQFVNKTTQSICQFRGLDRGIEDLFPNQKDVNQGLESNEATCLLDFPGEGRNSGEETLNGCGGKINHSREDNDHDEDERNKKQFANCSEKNEETQSYDNALLCPARNPNFYGESVGDGSESGKGGINKKLHGQTKPAKRGRPKKGEKRGNIREPVDLRDLLSRCAHAVSSYDNGTASELLRQIRQHSSPYGDANERLAHCFANALEARIAGMGSVLYTSATTRRASAADILRAYETYVTICPFQRMSNIFANKSIATLTGTAATVHIIDFGILYGFQWPCIIHGISLRPGGPPKLRITGIDLPQRGFRPAERVDETGRRLANYAKRFDLPFEFNAIAKRWDTITIEDLKIDKDEILVVNCLYRLRNVADETVEEMSPRDAVMNLIKQINPDFFVHGILNAGYNAPFFTTRFREALHHFSSLFDMFEATLPREDPERMLFEKEVLGRDAMNVIACEGTERVDRPDTYKQWQVRNQRAGFRQLPLNPAIMREVRVKVKSNYHKDFLIDEDSNWMLQGWKGRVIYALSCWKPAHK